MYAWYFNNFGGYKTKTRVTKSQEALVGSDDDLVYCYIYATPCIEELKKTRESGPMCVWHRQLLKLTKLLPLKQMKIFGQFYTCVV